MAAIAESNESQIQSEVKLTSNQLREMNDNLDLSTALTMETISQSNHVNSDHNDEPCDDNLIIVNGDIGYPPRRVTILIDCGASANFISKTLVEKCQLKNCFIIKIT